MNHESILSRKSFLLLTVSGLLTFVVFAISHHQIIAQTPTTAASQSEVERLQKKITELQGTENTLSKQVTLLDSQISVAQLRVESIKSAIIKLGSEIVELAGEIDRLEGVLTRRSELVLKRIPESYKRRQTPYIEALFLSKDFSDFLRRVKYISVVEKEDVQLLVQLKATQDNFSERKDLRESKKKQQEDLQKQLEKESKALEDQKKSKQALLDQTKSSEIIYQKLLAQALAERQAVDRAIIEGVKLGPIKKGDPIALVGNTGYPGCSTGKHLHYEIRRNNSWINAEDFLSPKTVQDDQRGGQGSVGSGTWDWPIEGGIILTQHYGKTPWSWRYSYSGGIHTGVDMYSTTSDVIKAPSDGTLYASAESCGNSSTIKIKYIDHGNGLVSLYLHVQ